MLASRIRDRLSRVQFAGDSIGATIGWAIYPSNGRSSGELLTYADEDLRTGKLTPQPGLAPVAQPGGASLVAPPSLA